MTLRLQSQSTGLDGISIIWSYYAEESGFIASDLGGPDDRYI